jgi:YHS domain-containing protein
MQRSAALFARLAGTTLPGLLLCVACSASQAPEAAPQQHKLAAAPEHTVPTDIKPAAADQADQLASSCGGGDHGSACGSGTGDSACGACGAHGQGSSCGQSTGHAACGGASDRLPSSDERAEDDKLDVLTRVEDPSQVCMVRNHFMGRPQLAIQADGSTYYGCCAGCANRLLQDARARQAIDPISHNPVDKGLAVLAKTSRGAVLYFENEANMQMFRATMQ